VNAKDLAALEQYLTSEERAEFYKLLEQDAREVLWRPLLGPQTMARQSKADIIGFGGSAGGGKTDWVVGEMLSGHERCLITRREKAQTDGIVQRLTEVLGNTNGFNGQKSVWRVRPNLLVEFAGLDNPGDERRWQGRPHDLKAFDEVTEMREHQVRFVMGWTRTNNPNLHAKVIMTFNPPTTAEGRWVIDFFGPWLDKKHPLYPTAPGVLRWAAMLPDGQGSSKDRWLPDGRAFVLVNGEPCYEFAAADHKPEDIIKPKSRTFIPARVTDNPYYMATDYMSTLQALPEPLRSQMLYGDFVAGIGDDPWQVVPTEWVEMAQARWVDQYPKGEMLTVGVDVARGGKDNTCIARKHAAKGGGLWFDRPMLHPGAETPDGPRVAGLVVMAMRDSAPINIDVIGVGASPYDFLNTAKQPVFGINVSEKASSTDKSGRLSFFNLRSQLAWQFRELLDPANNHGVALPPDPRLLKEICAFRWHPQGMVVYVESREEIIERLGYSPDMATAYILAAMDTPKRHLFDMNARNKETLGYNPLDNMK
jgi:phage terminase large subunit-like protein